MIRMFTSFLILTFIGYPAFAWNPFSKTKNAKVQWRDGCLAALLKHSHIVAQTNPIFAGNPELGKNFANDSCNKIEKEHDQRGDWKLTDKPALDGCGDAVRYLLDGAGVTDRERRKNTFIEYCL